MSGKEDPTQIFDPVWPGNVHFNMGCTVKQWVAWECAVSLNPWSKGGTEPGGTGLALSWPWPRGLPLSTCPHLKGCSANSKVTSRRLAGKPVSFDPGPLSPWCEARLMCCGAGAGAAGKAFGGVLCGSKVIVAAVFSLHGGEAEAGRAPGLALVPMREQTRSG